MSAFDPAEDDGLLVVEERGVRFSHPEARSAVYHAAAPSERRAAHRALAAGLAEHERAWHLAVAADQPDEELAAALERSAADAVARGAPGTALEALRRAATLSPDPGRGRDRTLAAGHLALLAGRPHTAIALATALPATTDLGEDDICVTNARVARGICERLGINSHRAVAEQALGMLALSKGELDAAIDHLERGREHRLRYGARDPGYMFNESDLTEAYARAGRLEDAERMLAELRAGAALTGGAWAAAATARYAALLGPNEAIDGHLEAARAAHARVDFTFEEARTQLIFGERLRRARRRVEARPPLAAAESTFRAQGARRWADRAAAELTAAGGRAPGAAGAGVGNGALAPATESLTARKREVCALVAGGATNAEVAASLFLSPRTVEHHLSHIYRKVGVRSRAQLAARFPAGGG